MTCAIFTLVEIIAWYRYQYRSVVYSYSLDVGLNPFLRMFPQLENMRMSFR